MSKDFYKEAKEAGLNVSMYEQEEDMSGIIGISVSNRL